MDAAIKSSTLQSDLNGARAPLVIDVRKTPTFHAAPDMIAGALRRDPAHVASWVKELPSASSVVVYCVHGHEVSQGVAQALRAAGISARYLADGIDEGWKQAGGNLMRKARNASTRWVTRERPKIDRIACPWLIARFVDPAAEFLYVPTGNVLNAAQEKEAIPYDIPDVDFSHDGDLCSFDAFLKTYHLCRSRASAAGAHRARRRHRKIGTRTAGGGTRRNIARLVAHIRRRSRDAQARHGDVRRALRVVQGRAGRDAYVESGGVCANVLIAREPKTLFTWRI